MSQKYITCIECPVGCRLKATKDKSGKINVSGSKCEKGDAYARKEMTCPERYLTSTILAEGLSMYTVPVRTDRPVPKEKINEIIEIIKSNKITEPIKCRDVIVNNVLGLGVNIVATRGVPADDKLIDRGNEKGGAKGESKG